MKTNFFIKTAILVTFLLLLFKTGYSQSLTIDTPLVLGNHYYDKCSSSLHPISCIYSGTPDTIKLPIGACLLDSLGNVSGITPTISNDSFYVYSGVSSFSKFKVDLTAISCRYFRDAAPIAQISVKSGSTTTSKTVALNHPKMKFSSLTSPFQCVKGSYYKRAYLLTTDSADADYDLFRIEASIESEIFVTNIKIEFLDSSNTVISTTYDSINIDSTIIPNNYEITKFNNVALIPAYFDPVYGYTLIFTKGSTSGLSHAFSLPANFKTNWKVRITETFAAISLQKNSGPSSYHIYLNSCNASTSSCSISGNTCETEIQGEMSTVCPGVTTCINYSGGDGIVVTLDSVLDIYDSTLVYTYRMLNNSSNTLHDSLGAVRLYDVQMSIDNRYFSLSNISNIEIGTINRSLTYTRLNIQPEINLINQADRQLVVICFKSIDLGIDPDSAGPLTNIFLNPLDTIASHQYRCDLPVGSSLAIKMRNLHFTSSDTLLHNCTYSPISFLRGVSTAFTPVNLVDLCVDSLRQYYPFTNFAVCDSPNVTNRAWQNNQGYINGTGNGNSFDGTVLSEASNTDIVQSPSNPYQQTQVMLTYSFEKSKGNSPWELVGPQTGCGQPASIYADSIISGHGQVYYAHVTIPSGFRIVSHSGVYYTTANLTNDSITPHYDSLTYHPYRCNEYDLLLPSVSSSISFYVQMDGCLYPYQDTSHCEGCSLNSHRDTTFGNVDFCVEFRSQLNNSAHHHDSVIVGTLRYLTYGCGSRTLFYHCDGGCGAGGSPINSDYVKMERNSFGYSSPDAFLAGNLPFSSSQSEEGKTRVYINDDILVNSSGFVIDSFNTCAKFLNFQMGYLSIVGTHDIFAFDSGLVSFSIISGTDTTIIPVNLNGSSRGDAWDTSKVNPSGSTSGNYLGVKINLDSIMSGSDTLRKLMRMHGASFTFAGHYHVVCTAADTLAPGHYLVDSIRTQFSLSGNPGCWYPSCDDWGAAMNMLIIENQIHCYLMDAAASTNEVEPTQNCAFRFYVGINTVGGYKNIQDFDGEYRPIVVYPRNFNFDVSNHAFLLAMKFRRDKNELNITNKNRYDISGTCNSKPATSCPSSAFAASPHSPGGTLSFHYDSTLHVISVNGDTSSQRLDTIGSNRDYLVQTEDEMHSFTFAVSRTCLDSAVVFLIDSIHFPVQFLNSYSTTRIHNFLTNNDIAQPSNCNTTYSGLENDSLKYINQGNELNRNLVNLLPQYPTDSIFKPSGNRLSFCATFDLLGIRQGWIYCPDSTVQLDTIEKLNSDCATPSTHTYMERNSNGLFYFNCNANTKQYLRLSMRFPCNADTNGLGYDTTEIPFRYGVFCNRCQLQDLNPFSAIDDSVLAECGAAHNITIHVQPKGVSLNLTATPTLDSITFCNTASFTLYYNLQNDSLHNSILTVYNSQFSSSDSALLIYGNDTLKSSYIGSNTLSFSMGIIRASAGTLAFIYYSSCSDFNNSWQTFSFRIEGIASCENEIFSHRPSDHDAMEFVAGSSTAPLYFKSPVIGSLAITGTNSYCSGGSTLLTAHPDSLNYQWYRNGVLVSGATNQTYTAQSGVYYFKASLPSCNRCSFTSVTDTVIENITCCDTISRVDIKTKIDSVSMFVVGNYSLNSDLVIQTGRMIILNKANLAIAAEVTISVDSGATLQLEDSSYLHACAGMWNGIVVHHGGTLIVSLATVISDADTAISNTDGSALISITNSTFSDNYVGISLANTNYSGTFELYASSFIGGVLEKSPYPGEKAWAALYLNKADSLIIGDEAQDQIIIDDFRNGIYSERSNFTVYNSHFQNMIYYMRIGEVDVPDAYAIRAYGDNIGTNPYNKTVIGGVNIYQSCQFTNCLYGIYTQKNVSSVIRNNSFIIDRTFAYSYQSIAISCSQNYKFSSPTPEMIINSNRFQNYGYGVIISACNYGFKVDSNNFNVNNWEVPLLNQRAIYVRNTTKNATPVFEINNNKIYKYNNGILATELIRSEIKNNIIGYHTTANGIRYGIKSEIGSSNTISGNTIYRSTTTLANEKLLYGITVESSINNVVSDNETSKMGTGIRFNNCSNPNTAKCNRLEYCVAGITLESRDIGSQGDSLHPANNFWTEVLSTTEANIRRYGLAPTPKPTWSVRNLPGYHPYFGGTNSQPYINPPGTVVVFNHSIINYGECNFNPCNDSTNGKPCWQQQLNNMVERSGPFSTIDDDGYQDICAFVFRELKEDPELMDLGTSFDANLVTFSDSMSSTNVGQLIYISELIQENDTTEAAYQNSIFNPEDLSETNSELVNEVYLSSWSNDIYEFDENQKNILINIAYQNPVNGGVAVYDARVMLGLDLFDYYDESYDRLAAPFNIARIGKIIPNPNNGTMQFSYQLNDGENGLLEIYDVRGRRMRQYNLEYSQSLIDIDMNSEASGLYFYRLSVNNRIVSSDKIVIEK
jgi:hypothetical protein